MSGLSLGSGCQELSERVGNEVKRTVRENAHRVEEGLLDDAEKVQDFASRKFEEVSRKGQEGFGELKRELERAVADDADGEVVPVATDDSDIKEEAPQEAGERVEEGVSVRN